MNKNIKILVIDDEEDFVKMLTSWLKSKGYSTESASNGKTAIQLIEKDMPDVVLMDLRMPVMNGVETLKSIRKIKRDLPVIVISAYINDPIASEAQNYGISGVFYKGENFEQVLPVLESVLRTHKKLKE